MADRQLHLLSPYRMPTSYPLQMSSDEIASWLNGYIVLWHPAVLAGAAQPPQGAAQSPLGRLAPPPSGPRLA